MIVDVLKKHEAEFFVMYASSRNANFYYATKFKTYDPVIYIIGVDGTDLLVVPEMERRRAERESRVKEIAPLENLGFKEKVRELRDAKKALLSVLISLLKEGRCRTVLVPEEMPSFMSFELTKHFTVKVVRNPFSKLRIVKSASEVEKIGDVSRAITSTFEWFVKNFSFERCEEARRAIETHLFSLGYLAENTICSTGRLSADPHELGHGEIEDHLVVDVFPRSLEHLYHSDFTRTVFVNRNPELEDMYSAVIDAQEEAIKMIREGVDGREVHEKVKEVLEERGYRTANGEGFIHSTGHGIGLEIHEEPRLGEQSVTLKSGMVVTVEPGLYYKDVGGVRVEDTVLVTRSGCEVLTPYPKFIRLY